VFSPFNVHGYAKNRKVKLHQEAKYSKVQHAKSSMVLSSVTAVLQEKAQRLNREAAQKIFSKRKDKQQMPSVRLGARQIRVRWFPRLDQSAEFFGF
jgi:hypothetical protein